MKTKRLYKEVFEEELLKTILLDRYNGMNDESKNIIDARVAYKIAVRNNDLKFDALNDVIKNPYYAFLFVKDVLKSPNDKIYQVLKDTEFEYDYKQLFGVD